MVKDRVWVAPQMSQGDGEACREFMAEEEERPPYVRGEWFQR